MTPVPSKTSGKVSLALLGKVAGAGSVIMVLGILLFILRNERAHDPERCPFETGDTREVAEGVAVREELRRCLEGVEERRWMILREGEPPREFARRRLDARYFSDGAYAWKVTQAPSGDLVLDVENGDVRAIQVLEAKLLDQR